MNPTTTRIGTLVIAGLVASALAGCASGGGGGGGGNGDDIACVIAGPFCAFMGTPTSSGDTTASSAPVSPPAPQFTSFADLQPGQAIGTTSALNLSLSYSQSYTGVLSAPSYFGPEYEEFISTVVRDSEGKVLAIGYGVSQATPPQTSLAANGQPAIQVWTENTYWQTGFTSVPASSITATANPYDLGWNYQTFGVWEASWDSYMRISSVGSVTPASAIPTTGAATFNGKLAGFYISPAGVGSVASADLKVDANFGARSLSFASTGTMTTRDFAAATAMPGLNMSGTLTYSAGTNSFSGTLTSANGLSGTSKGRFYGPNAQELGGVFTLTSPSNVENFTGAYGAKR